MESIDAKSELNINSWDYKLARVITLLTLALFQIITYSSIIHFIDTLFWIRFILFLICAAYMQDIPLIILIKTYKKEKKKDLSISRKNRTNIFLVTIISRDSF